MNAIKWLLPVVLAVVTGCATATEADRQLNDQSMQAAALIAEKYVADAVGVQAAKDIFENCRALEQNALGAPKERVPYSKEASEALRRKSTEEHAMPWWQKALWTLFGVVTTVLGGGVAQRFFPTLLGGPAGTIASVLMTGLTKLRAKAAEAPLTNSDIVNVIKDEQVKAGIQELVAPLVKKVEEKLGIAPPHVGPPSGT